MDWQGRRGPERGQRRAEGVWLGDWSGGNIHGKAKTQEHGPTGETEPRGS